MRISPLPFRALTALALMMSGCYVPNKQFRALQNSFIEVQLPPPLPVDAPQNKAAAQAAKQELPCMPGSLATKPCVAFVEFDDMGEAWTIDNRNYLNAIPPGWPQPNSNKPKPVCASQLCNALALVREADRQATAAGSQAIIVTFTHGWKHNAKEGDPNVEGFKAVLNNLQRQYQRIVVGVYISWRGDLVPDYMPLRRQFTFFNREAAATRVPGASVTDALIRISEVAHSRHDVPGDNNRPYVVFVGHSFGGLFVERALSQALVRQMEDLAKNEEAKERGSSRGRNEEAGYPAFADLVVMVNSAAAATQAKETLDFLASNKIEYRGPRERLPNAVKGEATPCGDAATGVPCADKPLILSVSSSADVATRFLFPVGHALPYLGYQIHGSFRGKDSESLVCYTPPRGASPAQSFLAPATMATAQGSYFTQGAAHMAVLQSHALAPCEQASSTPVFGQYRIRDNGSDSGKCFNVVEAQNRCNGTPYWMMEIDPSIVPDHGTIFTGRFVDFLSLFLLREDLMSDVNQRPQFFLAK